MIKSRLKILALGKGINNDKLIGNKITSNSFHKAKIPEFIGVHESRLGSRNYHVFP